MKNFDPQSLMSQAKRMKDDLARIQRELKDRMVEGVAGGGLVSVVANGAQEIQAIRIKPEAVDPTDVEMLEDLVTVAVKAALEKAKKLENEETAKVTGGLGRARRSECDRFRSSAQARHVHVQHGGRCLEATPNHSQRLIDEFARLPGIGTRTAERLAFYILKCDDREAMQLAVAIRDAKKKILRCKECFNVAEQEILRDLHGRRPRSRRGHGGRAPEGPGGLRADRPVQGRLPRAPRAPFALTTAAAPSTSRPPASSRVSRKETCAR